MLHYNSRLYVTTMKAMIFHDDSPAIPIDYFKNDWALAFDLTSMQNATGNCRCPDLVGEPLRLELNFTYPLEHVIQLNVLGERMSSVAVDKFGVVGKNLKWIMFLSSKQSIVSCYPSIGIFVHFFFTIFQCFPMKLIPFQIRNTAVCKVSIG